MRRTGGQYFPRTRERSGYTASSREYGCVHSPEITDRIVKQAREIRSAEFCTLDEVRARCADFTTRRIEASLANPGGGPAYTESGV